MVYTYDTRVEEGVGHCSGHFVFFGNDNLNDRFIQVTHTMDKYIDKYWEIQRSNEEHLSFYGIFFLTSGNLY